MEYKIASQTDINEILIMKNKVKDKIIKDGLPIWKNGYPLDEVMFDDIINGFGRIVLIDNKIVAYACLHPSNIEYEKGLFKKDKLYSFSRVMVHIDFTNRRIGDFLVKSMINEVKSFNVLGMGIAVDACNIKAITLYKRNHFMKESEHSFPYAYLDLYTLYF